jgi:hypothetical protein
MKLNKEQIEELRKDNWGIVPESDCFELYKKDFVQKKKWSQLCEQLNISKDSDSVNILYIAKISTITMIL